MPNPYEDEQPDAADTETAELVDDEGDPDDEERPDDVGDDQDGLGAAPEDLAAMARYVDSLGDLYLGAPFVLTGDLQVHEAYAIVSEDADSRRKFKINLLTDKLKRSPTSGESYTHCLVITPNDDPNIVLDLLHQVLASNGVEIPELDAPDAGDEPE